MTWGHYVASRTTRLPAGILDDRPLKSEMAVEWSDPGLAVEWDTRLKSDKDGVTTVTRIITPAEAIYWHLDLVRRGRWNHESREITITLHPSPQWGSGGPFVGEIVAMKSPDYWHDVTPADRRPPFPNVDSLHVLLRITDPDSSHWSYCYFQTHHIKEIRWTPTLWEHF